ncbi:uncharacterized protein SAPINGB_P002737 [Magnusiomyces paraingens]|uniref:Ubiquinone biosynthesis O-methyltransferase, mitochondrial n=1 Tax=Magnusiomyces paraingens TaxID=2606893 RepID=A0A5E8BFH9_9ASCO|nr:uncharacterized protein SAPINGB_P002737 [Saprochaete ingens]VVT50386.1 unnamed protein product [Saprochaete ingens]
MFRTRIAPIARNHRVALQFFRNHSSSTGTTSDELSHFAQLADSWWDVNGPQRILHKMNLLRLDFIFNMLKANWDEIPNSNYKQSEKEFIPGYSFELLPTEELKKHFSDKVSFHESQLFKVPQFEVLDVGCGGGILSECLARLPFTKKVRGIDLSPDVLAVAEAHKKKDPLLADKLDYRLAELGSLDKTKEQYDIITLFEVLEHVEYPSEVLSQAIDRLKPGGWMFLSTINRTPISYFTTIFVGEHLLNIVPKGTHTLSKYINESELREWFNNRQDCDVISSEGCLYIPAYGWKLTGSPNVGNYFMAIRKRK